MARLFADENFPLPTVDILRTLGHDVETAHEAGRANREIPDDQVLKYATTQSRAVLTLNRRHFIRLHRTTEDHAGIVACKLDGDFEALALRVHQAVTEAGSIRGCLIRINRPQRSAPPPG